MPSTVTPGPVMDDAVIKEAVCIHTKKIFDSCKDKDCVEDLRLYMGPASQARVDSAVSIRPKTADLLCVNTNVDEVTFNRGFYTIDVRYYYRVTGEALAPMMRPEEFMGLAVFEKRVILFGSEGTAKVFSSDGMQHCRLSGANLPTAVVEAVDPILLSMRMTDGSPCATAEPVEIPREICELFGEENSFALGARQVYVTLGQFSIVRLERDTQLLIPAYDYCMPEKECVCGSDDDPCALFSRIGFPVDEFFPPDAVNNPECYKEAVSTLNH